MPTIHVYKSDSHSFSTTCSDDNLSTVNETNVYTFATNFCYNQGFKFLARLNLKTRIHTHTHTPTPIYTHILTITHKRNLNGFLSAFCRISILSGFLSHFRFSISFHLLNCLMNVVINFKKPSVAEQYFPLIEYIYNIYLYILFTLFTNPSARAGYDTRSIFKRSLTEFSFS